MKNQYTKKISSINAFILAGGKSSRMKFDKAFLRYRGRYLIDIAISTLAEIFEKVAIIGRQYQHPLLTDSYLDEIKGKGPLGGIYTALGKTSTSYNFITAIDYPFINRDIILRIITEVKLQGNQFLVYVPVTDDGPHPLFSAYSIECRKYAHQCIAQNSLSVQCITRQVPTYFLGSNSFSDIPKDRVLRCFTNVNSIRDYNHIISRDSLE